MISRSSLLRASRLARPQALQPIRRPQQIQQRRARTTADSSAKASIEWERSRLVGARDNAFNRERLAVREHAVASADLWRKLCIYIVIPSLILASMNAKNLWDEHWEHFAHDTPMSEKPQYEYLNIRRKPFPWGDGTKTLFWNDKVNYMKPADEE